MRRAPLRLGVLAALLAGCDGAAPPPSGPPPTACGAVEYPDWETSDYVLPYPVGERYSVLQGNCGAFSHTPATDYVYAYDFAMLVGEALVASRAGRVALVVERYEDYDNTPGHENGVAIEHADGTWAFYVHLTEDGAAVEVGDLVAQGDTVGYSGNTGFSTEPHLHFDVRAGCPERCESVPVTFRNTEPNPGGLLQGRRYTALP